MMRGGLGSNGFRRPAAPIVLVLVLALRDASNGGVVRASPRIIPGPDVTSPPLESASSKLSLLGRGGENNGNNGGGAGACFTATENRHLVADSHGGVCSPLALDADTGCCHVSAREMVSNELCDGSCSKKKCCDSFAKCVVCCHRELASNRVERGEEELTPVSPMHPSMWRKWLIVHDDVAKARGGGDVRGESFSGGDDQYAVSPFDYCKHRCRSNSAVTKNENEFQDARHHCFAGEYVENIGAQDTLSPGQNSLHDQNSDFKLVQGESVDLGLVPSHNGWRSERRRFNAENADVSGHGGEHRNALPLTFFARLGKFLRDHVVVGQPGGFDSKQSLVLTLFGVVAVLAVAMALTCVWLLRDNDLADEFTRILR